NLTWGTDQPPIVARAINSRIDLAAGSSQLYRRLPVVFAAHGSPGLFPNDYSLLIAQAHSGKYQISSFLEYGETVGRIGSSFFGPPPPRISTGTLVFDVRPTNPKQASDEAVKRLRDAIEQFNLTITMTPEGIDTAFSPKTIREYISSNRSQMPAD